MGNVLLARMGEITLKGLNRGAFEIQLKSNLKYRLKKFGDLKIYQSQSRIWIEPKEEDNPNFRSMEAAQDIMKAVCQVFGIVSVSLARKFEGDFESIKENTVECIKVAIVNHIGWFCTIWKPCVVSAVSSTFTLWVAIAQCICVSWAIWVFGIIVTSYNFLTSLVHAFFLKARLTVF